MELETRPFERQFAKVEDPADAAALKALLVPYPAEKMTLWPVGKRVGSVKNNDPSLIEPAAMLL